MRKAGLRIPSAASLACALLLACAGTAHAADPIVAGPGAAISGFSQATYAMAPGERPTFQNNEPGVPHNVIARGRIGGGPLFLTPTITGVSSAVVNGTQYLNTGSHEFFCSIHPTTMVATLQISGAGTPVARPRIAVKVLTGNLKRVRRSGKVPVRIRAFSRSNGASLTLRLANRFAGRVANLNLDAGQARRVVIKLTKRARKRLAKRKRAQAVLIGSVPFGANARASRVLK
jgi:plastocyanin